MTSGKVSSSKQPSKSTQFIHLCSGHLLCSIWPCLCLVPELQPLGSAAAVGLAAAAGAGAGGAWRAVCWLPTHYTMGEASLEKPGGWRCHHTAALHKGQGEMMIRSGCAFLTVHIYIQYQIKA